tara:strand:- start:682 stop:2649 length:1968 start_codon:yes stop_codon:yes gene_type:complete
MSKLIIVESNTKAKKIQQFLGKDYKVIASFGHICDLPKNDLGIDTSTWNCTYVDTKPDIIKNIKYYIKNSSIIYLASDNDREGHAISYLISKLITKKPYYRIVFNEITKKALLNALENTSDIPMNLVYSQECRRILDRLCGYKLSPILWNEFNQNTLSCGRVQTVVLGFCIDRMKEIELYNTSVSWNIIADFSSTNMEFKNAKHDIVYDSKIEALNHLKEIKWKYDISFTKKNVNKNPFPPYMTTTIQIDVYKQFHIGSKKCMEILQKLYENGFITYHRTDSLNISNEFINKLKNHIVNKYGEDYLKIRTFKTNSKNSQEAHECIRITHIDSDTSILDKLETKIYNMIFIRTLASQMSSAIYIEYEYIFTNKTPYKFFSSKQFLKFDGYLILTDVKVQDEIIPKGSITMENLKTISNISKCPSYYDESNIIRLMENKGIGRPSTYASILNNILTRNYIEKGSNPNKEVILYDYSIDNKGSIKELKKKDKIFNNTSNDLLIPTEIGKNIHSFLLKKVEFITNIEFTSKMEESLDKIALKEVKHTDILDSFYHKLKEILSKIEPKKNENEEIKILNTKYGRAIYIRSEKRYINIESYIKIMNRELNKDDIRKLIKLPIKLENENSLCLGKFGFYMKDKDGNNKSISKKIWENIWNNI